MAEQCNVAAIFWNRLIGLNHISACSRQLLSAIHLALLFNSISPIAGAQFAVFSRDKVKWLSCPGRFTQIVTMSHSIVHKMSWLNKNLS